MTKASQDISEMLKFLEENIFLEKWYHFSFFTNGDFAVNQGETDSRVSLHFSPSTRGGWQVTKQDSLVILNRKSVASFLEATGVPAESVIRAVEARVAAQAIWLQTRVARVESIMGSQFVENSLLRWQIFEDELISLIKKYSSSDEQKLKSQREKKPLLRVVPPP